MALNEIETQIVTVLEKIRPFLIRDGGDIEYVGYKDGEFALMFCEIIDEIEQPPFSINVIAKGEKESYDDVQTYIERFLD